MKQEVKTIENTLQPYVEKLLGGLEKGVDLATEHIPDVIMQYVVFEAIIAWLWILGALFFLYKTPRWIKRAAEVDPNWDTPLSAVAYLGYGVSGLMFMNNIGTAIKATFFPKLFLISEFIKIF